jgi:hypothetical protein
MHAGERGGAWGNALGVKEKEISHPLRAQARAEVCVSELASHWQGGRFRGWVDNAQPVWTGRSKVQSPKFYTPRPVQSVQESSSSLTADHPGGLVVHAHGQ